MIFPGLYALNGWLDETPNKSHQRFNCLGTHMPEQAHLIIKELYIVSVPQFNPDVSIYPVLLVATYIMFMYNCYFGTNLGHNKYVYTNLLKSS